MMVTRESIFASRVKSGADGLKQRELLLLLVAGAFIFINAAGLSLVDSGALRWRFFFGPTIWFVLFLVAHHILSRFGSRHDPFLLPVVGLLAGWGLVMLNRLAPNFVQRQVVWLSISVMVMLVVALFRWDLGFLRRYRYTWLLLGLLLLLSTLFFGVNPSGQGATLWLKVPLFGSVFFQPSELLKLLLVVFLASYFAERRRVLNKANGQLKSGIFAFLGPLVLMWGFCILLLVWQRDLGAATLFFIVFLAMLYLATGEWRYVAGGLLLLLVAGILGYLLFEVVALRVDMWWNPWPESAGRGFQIVQSLYAVAAGNILGQGVGQGFPTYIPVVHSDFAFAAMVEEWGLIGGLVTVFCFILIAYRGMRIAASGTQAFSILLAAGITLVLTIQTLLIMGGVAKLFPLTGVTLPFVSYGGSSLIVSSIMMGLLLKLSLLSNQNINSIGK